MIRTLDTSVHKSLTLQSCATDFISFRIPTKYYGKYLDEILKCMQLIYLVKVAYHYETSKPK